MLAYLVERADDLLPSVGLEVVALNPFDHQAFSLGYLDFGH